MSSIKNDMKRYFQTISYFAFLGLGVFLLYEIIKKYDILKIWDTLQSADTIWVFVILVISIFNHLSRAKRWQLLLSPLGRTVKLREAFISLMSGYLVSYLIPRLGEITRTLAIVKTEKLSFQGVLGTVIMERIIDVTCLFIVLLLAISVEYEFLTDFYFNQIHESLSVFIESKLVQLRLLGMFLVLLGTLILVLVILKWKEIKKSHWVKKLILSSLKVWRGIVSIFRMPHKWQFVLHTSFIWFTYFLMTYLWFYSFEETAHLSWKAGLVMMVVGSFARSLPIQGGGMGAYHYLFTQAIVLYGVAGMYGLALAVMIHGLQTVYYIVVGGICWLILLLRRSHGSLR